jgi:hypothetical protein
MRSQATWRKIFGVYAIFGVVFAGLALLAPAGPPAFRVEPPSANLAPGLAALSGVWEATEGPTRQVVVEWISGTQALILLTWDDHSLGQSNRGWERVHAHVSRDCTVQWGYPVRFTLKLIEAGAVLEQERVGAPTRILLRKLARNATLLTAMYPPGERAGGAPVR